VTVRDDDTFTALLPNGERIRLCKRDIEKLNDLDPGEVMRAMLKMLPSPRNFNACLARQEAEEMAKADHDEDDDGGDRDTGGDGGGIADHPVVRLAGLLVASGKFPDHAQALDHLLNTPRGAALVRTHKAETKEPSMTPQEKLRDIVKTHGSAGLVEIAKTIIDAQRSYGIGEAEFTKLMTEHAQRLYPDKTPDAAFVKLFSDNSADGVLLRKAHALTKGVADLTPSYVGGPAATHEAIDETEQSEAYAQLVSMAEKMRAASPELSAAQAFDRVFTDKRNASLAAKAHRTPTPPPGGAYAWPR
jgi:hypothetical protein